MIDDYLTLAELAAYSKISVRQLRKYLALPPGAALPCYRPGRSVRVRRHEFDAWFAQYRTRGKVAVARVLRELGLDPERIPEVRRPAARIVRPAAPRQAADAAPRRTAVEP